MTAGPRPIRRQVLLGCPPDRAQRLWTDEIGTWWPLEEHSCHGAGGSVAIELDATGTGQIVETGAGGERATWGAITELSPETLAFTWHPGELPDRATRVTLSFTEVGTAATLLTLTHTGWEILEDPEGTRAGHATDWELEIAALTALLPANQPGDLWFVLLHTAGPATPPSGVFSSPDFPLHMAFLSSLLEQGVLVAGGPLPDDPGAGMTVVRTPDLATGRQVVEAAQLADGAVRAGLLDVLIRPWQVTMTG